MSSIVITGIDELVTNDPEVGDGSPLGLLTDGAVAVEAGLIRWVGRAADAPAADRRIEVGGRAVLPGFVDSHAHLVFGGDRAAEFAARMSGEPYDGGGIATTVAATRAASTGALRALVARRVAEMRAQGTTTVEIKSGYGLTVVDEVRSLVVAREFTSETTFLGAHVVPPGADRDQYLQLIMNEMLPALRRLRALAGRVLRAGESARLRRERGAGAVGGRAAAWSGPAGSREPVVCRTGRPVGGRVRSRERRPLHPPD